MKRAKEVPSKCANPLFEKWLLEWKEEAKLKSSHVEYHFEKAIIALRKYPLPLETGRDCILLQHFGTKLCAMLDRKLKSHLETKRVPHTSDTEHIDTCDDVEPDILPKKSKSMEGNSLDVAQNKKKPFVPKQPRFVGGKKSKKKENITTDCLAVPAGKLQEKNQENINIVPRRSREHSISSSGSSCHDNSPVIEILDNIDNEIAKNPVPASTNNTAKEKPKIAKKPGKKTDKAGDSRDIGAVTSADSVETLIKDQFEMAPNSFDVLLLVDTRETAGAKTKAKDDATISELNSLKTQYEIRHLKIGDFAWVARCRETKRELVLPYVVERKRMDDLASSIKDGRYHEQKFRLKRSGIPNIIYMVESNGKNLHLGLPLQTLFQASTNSLVQDGFGVKFTDSHRHSMQYLSILTTLIHQKYQKSHLVSSTKEDLNSDAISGDKIPLMEFKQFNKASSKAKTFTVKEMFLKHLLQLKGLSVEKALAIVELYPTPVVLLQAFQEAGKGAEKLLAPLKVGTLQRQLGPALSKTIFELYTKTTLE